MFILFFFGWLILALTWAATFVSKSARAHFSRPPNGLSKNRWAMAIVATVLFALFVATAPAPSAPEHRGIDWSDCEWGHGDWHDRCFDPINADRWLTPERAWTSEAKIGPVNPLTNMTETQERCWACLKVAEEKQTARQAEKNRGLGAAAEPTPQEQGRRAAKGQAPVAAAATITEYPVPAGSRHFPPGEPAGEVGLGAITPGPDGNLWFTALHAIWKATPGGTFTEYAIPSADGTPWSITTGPDGNLWFTESGIDTDKIAKVTTGGRFTEYRAPSVALQPFGAITTGPDGNLWFTESKPGRIGKVTPRGAFTEYTVPGGDSQLSAITTGPDGNLWFVDSGRIGMATTNGRFAEYPVPSADSVPYGITAGADGNLWFTDIGKIGKVTPGGTFTEYALPDTAFRARAITAGPDGNLWFTESGPLTTGLKTATGKIGRVTTGGVFTEYPVPTAADPLSITAGPDGSLWFTYENANKIGRVNLPHS